MNLPIASLTLTDFAVSGCVFTALASETGMLEGEANLWGGLLRAPASNLTRVSVVGCKASIGVFQVVAVDGAIVDLTPTAQQNLLWTDVQLLRNTLDASGTGTMTVRGAGLAFAESTTDSAPRVVQIANLTCEDHKLNMLAPSALLHGGCILCVFLCCPDI